MIFRNWVLQNFPFLEDDFDALTDYELFCKMVEYMKESLKKIESFQSSIDTFSIKLDEFQHYFDNLDVQEEINNKLDEMVEDGTLQEIISEYLNSNALFCFDSVYAMSLADNLINGSYARTTGYYSSNDGGGALYKIRTKNISDTPDGAFIIQMSDTNLVAELIIEDNTVNILQMGAHADNETDDQPYFTNAMTKGNLKIIVPKKENPYLVSYLGVRPNIILEGIDFPTINIQRESSTDTTSYIMSNSKMYNLNIQCINEDMIWSRFAILNADNVVIKDCTFEGFRDLNPAPNAWGLLINGSSNFVIENCTFNNNSQSDIAVENSNSNGVIKNCYGNHLNINFEANNNNIVNENITVENCNIEKLSLLCYSNDKWDFKNINIVNSPIGTLIYRGACANLINSPVANIHSSSYFMSMGGELKNINSIFTEKNMNDDPYFMNIVPSSVGGNHWIAGYSAGSNMLKAFNTNAKGRYLTFNPSNANEVVSIYRDFTVTENTSYLISCLMNTKTLTNMGLSGRGLEIQFYNDIESSWGNKNYIVLDRNYVANTESPFTEKTCIFKTPSDCTKIRIRLCNTESERTSYNSSSFAKLYLCKITNTKQNVENDNKCYSDMPNTTNIPLVGTNSANVVGDKIYARDLSDGYLGYICTGLGNGNVNTWKKFGELVDIT